MRLRYAVAALAVLFICSWTNGCARRVVIANAEDDTRRITLDENSAPKVDENIPFKFSENDFGTVTLEDVAADIDESTPDSPEMPYDAPAHRCYNLERKAPLPALEKGARYFFPAHSFICIVPTSDTSTKDFAAAYPSFNKAVIQMGTLLKKKPAEFEQYDDLFDFPYNNASWAFKTKVEYLSYEHVSGVFFVTQYSQDVAPNPANNEELTANFQGISNDGRYYIGARFSITHNSLPQGIDFTDDRVQNEIMNKLRSASEEEINRLVGAYVKREEEKVRKLSDDSFVPPLSSIKKLIASLSIP